MTPIIRDQKVRKRKKHKKVSRVSLKPERFYILTARLKKAVIRYVTRIRKLTASWQWTRGNALSLSACVLSLVAAIVIMSSGVFSNLEVILPEDPELEANLLKTVASEFDGRGSGEVPDLDISFISGIDPISYVIQPGDTLSEIAKRYNITVGTLIGYNGIENVRRIIPGEVLKIPDIDGIPYKVKPGDSLDSIAETYNVSLNELLDANDLASSLIQPGDDLFIPGGQISEYEYRKATGTLFLYPTRGNLTSYFGYRNDPFTGRRRFHYGIDLANRSGTTVTATMTGVVIDTGERPTGYGKYIIVRHNYGFQSLYAHLDTILVREGQRVEQGGTLGTMGNTGRSTGPHLHFSIYKNNSPINPLNYLF